MSRSAEWPDSRAYTRYPPSWEIVGCSIRKLRTHRRTRARNFPGKGRLLPDSNPGVSTKSSRFGPPSAGSTFGGPGRHNAAMPGIALAPRLHSTLDSAVRDARTLGGWAPLPGGIDLLLTQAHEVAVDPGLPPQLIHLHHAAPAISTKIRTCGGLRGSPRRGGICARHLASSARWP